MNSQIKTTIQTEGDMKDDNPSVVAYRVSQLEIAQKESLIAQTQGFKDLSDKIDSYITKFVSQATFDDVKRVAEQEHKELSSRITKLENWRDKIVNKIAGWAVIALVLMVLAFYGLDKFFK